MAKSLPREKESLLIADTSSFVRFKIERWFQILSQAMNALARLPLALILAATGVWFWFELADPYQHAAAGIGILLGFLLITHSAPI
jgi:hypothetical protein